jgi:hypothetical protein
MWLFKRKQKPAPYKSRDGSEILALRWNWSPKDIATLRDDELAMLVGAARMLERREQLVRAA